MNLNKSAISRLLALDDTSLAEVIRSIAAEAGVDASKISLSPSDVSAIRAALSVATADDVAKLYRQLTDGKK